MRAELVEYYRDFPIDEHVGRTERLRAVLGRQGLDAALLTYEPNIRWLVGYHTLFAPKWVPMAVLITCGAESRPIFMCATDATGSDMAVVDDAGNLLAYARMDRCLRPTYAIRKAYTSAVRGMDTLAFSEQLSSQGRSLESFGDAQLIAIPGGVTVVHNGQLTNYHRLRRMYEDRGFLFQTGNDSELIAVYLADKMANGQTLDDVLADSLDDLDGTFTYLVSTRDGLGYAKDRWSAKPLVMMETDDVVALASEEVALRSIFSDEIDRTEPQEGEFMTWSL